MNNSKKEILDLLKTIIVATLIALFIKSFLFSVAYVNQTSMFPTLDDGTVLLSSSYYKFSDNKKRGDIIVFKSPIGEKYLIKRIIGLPNDNIEIIDGNIYINDKLYKEDYLIKDSYTQSEKTSFKLHNDEYFVLGDNRPVSIDSRKFGPIKKNLIKSKPFFRLYPFDKFGSINK